MSNMSYCRYRNTVNDFRGCLESLRNEDELSPDEVRARRILYKLALDFISEYEAQVESAIIDEGRS